MRFRVILSRIIRVVIRLAMMTLIIKRRVKASQGIRSKAFTRQESRTARGKPGSGALQRQKPDALAERFDGHDRP